MFRHPSEKWIAIVVVAIAALCVLGAAPAAAQCQGCDYEHFVNSSLTPIADRARQLAMTEPPPETSLIEHLPQAPQAPQATDWVMVAAVAGYGTCVVVDALSSGAAIASGNGAEGNPIYQDVQDNYFRFGLRRGLLASITPIASYLLHKKGGRVGRNVAKVLLGTTAAAYCYIGHRNAEIASGQ